MYILRLTISTIFVLMITYSVSSAQTDLLIAANDACQQDDIGSEDSTLFRVDPSSGVLTEIGPIGFNAVTGMTVLGDGRLVASARADANGDRISILIEINPMTGQGTLIGTIGNNNEGGCGRAPDLTYDPTTDTLYGIGFRCVPGDGHGGITELLTINQTTGQGTTVGQTGFFGGGNGLAISPNLTLFSMTNFNFLSINPNTGAGSPVALATLPNGVISALDFHPETGELFGIEFQFVTFPTFLVTIDTSNSNINRLTELPVCSDALVFMERQQRNVPTLSQWGLIAMAGLLGIVGFMVIRRKRLTA